MGMKPINQSDIEENFSQYNDNYNSTPFQPDTLQPFWLSYNHSSLGNAENGNASRHFADHPESSGVLGIEAIIIVVVVSLIPVSVIACMVFVISFDCLKRRKSFWSTSSLTEADCKKQISNRTQQAGVQSIIIDSENGIDHLVTDSGDQDLMIDTPLSIYPADPFSNFLDTSKSCLTTPISNNSIITMTMRNNHLIVETEERIPCSLLNVEQMYNFNMENLDKSYVQNEAQEFEQDDSFGDEVDSFCKHHHLHVNQYACTVCEQENRSFFEPTTSRQADEEDQLVELFHKNILAFPTSLAVSDATVSDATVAVDVEVECSKTSNASSNCELHQQRIQQTSTTHTTINHVQSQCGFIRSLSSSSSSSSSSSTSKQAQCDYSYGNQCEYISVEYPFKKRNTCSKAQNYSTYSDRNVTTIATISCHTTSISVDSFPFQNSVQPLTDCSFLEYSDSSK